MNSPQRQTLEQQRAAHAWAVCMARSRATGTSETDQASFDAYGKAAKGLPALIINSGLMQVLAFLEDKKGDQACLGADLRDWLKTSTGLPADFIDCMDALHGADPATFRRVHEEALAWLRWVRQFAPALKNAQRP